MKARYDRLIGRRVSTGFETDLTLETLPVIDKVDLKPTIHEDKESMIHCDHGWFRLTDVAVIWDEESYRNEYH